MAARNRHAERGLTLVELAIVVAIVGILATLATVGYRRMVTSSYITEATRMVNAIRIAQETVKAETGSYVNLGGSTLCPQGNADPTANAGRKFGWNPECSSGAGKWSLLPVQTDGPVRYGYMTVANVAPAQAVAFPASGAWDGNINGVAPNWGALGTPQTWFIAVASGDMDGNGVASHAVGSSLTNEVWIDNEGE